MNYIEFEIGGKKRGFRFGIGAIGDIISHFDNDFETFLNLIKTNGFKVTAPTLFHSHAYEVRKNGGIVDFTLYDVEEWVMELEGGFHNNKIQDLFAVLIDSVVKYLPVSKEEEKTAKKK